MYISHSADRTWNFCSCAVPLFFCINMPLALSLFYVGSVGSSTKGTKGKKDPPPPPPPPPKDPPKKGSGTGKSKGKKKGKSSKKKRGNVQPPPPPNHPPPKKGKSKSGKKPPPPPPPPPATHGKSLSEPAATSEGEVVCVCCYVASSCAVHSAVLRLARQFNVTSN